MGKGWGGGTNINEVQVRSKMNIPLIDQEANFFCYYGLHNNNANVGSLSMKRRRFSHGPSSSVKRQIEWEYTLETRPIPVNPIGKQSCLSMLTLISSVGSKGHTILKPKGLGDPDF